MKIALGSLLFALLISPTIAKPVIEEPGRRLSSQEMALTIGNGCGEAAGIGLSFAFAAGVTAAGFPPLSAGFLTAAVAMEIGVLLLC